MSAQCGRPDDACVHGRLAAEPATAPSPTYTWFNSGDTGIEKFTAGTEKRCPSTVVFAPARPFQHRSSKPSPEIKMATTLVSLPLPALPEGWAADKDFKPVGKVSGATQRTIEPIGPHFLAHARRARHKRTFSEDDRIQAQERAKKVEEDNDSDISEPEDAMLLAREAKDWKVPMQPRLPPPQPSPLFPLTQLSVCSPRTTTRFSASPSTASRPPRTRSSARTARRS